MKNLILIENNLVDLSSFGATTDANKSSSSIEIGTIIANLAYYGYVLSRDAYTTLLKLSSADISNWWIPFEEALKEITGDNRNISEYVVYKNFPKEVLDKTLAEYWIAQILMYWGFPNELFTEEEKARETMLDKLNLKVLHLANDKSLLKIYRNVSSIPARWTNKQYKQVLYLYISENPPFDVKDFPFKENLVKFLSVIIDEGVSVKLRSATDVIRLAVGFSGGDVSFRTNTKFVSFKRSLRRFFLDQLNNCSGLELDVARNKELWKRFFRNLHPGEFSKGNRYSNVCQVYNKLYNKQARSFNSIIEAYFRENNLLETTAVLASMPGEFLRRLRRAISSFGSAAAAKFQTCLEKLSTVQLLKIQKYITTINNRQYRTIPPRGNWNKLQILPNNFRMDKEIVSFLDEAINKCLADRLNKQIPSGVNLCESASLIKLQTNDSELAPYGRGTSFPIPDNIKFIRTASYWQLSIVYSNWYDNGWNFFDEHWDSKGVICWDEVKFKGAAWSGDPTNNKTTDGKACQLIDLYIDTLLSEGVRYAVWSILCFSNKKFSEANEVFAALQWGEEPQKGKLFEPSRCQLAFPLKGDYLTKFIAYIDLKERKLVYMDANFRAQVRSASLNSNTLKEIMPAYVEYLDTIPSVHDLFRNVDQSPSGSVIAFSDEGMSINSELAYVFRPANPDNKFEQIDLSKVLKGEIIEEENKLSASA